MARKKLESKFQSELIQEIKERFPGAMVLKNDPNYIQGVPDLIIMWGDKWAMLEVKRGSNYKTEPNQEYYVSMLRRMSYSAIIHPENYDIILDQMERVWNDIGATRLMRPLS